MTNKEAKEKLYMEWQKFLENNIDYAGISEAYKTAFKALEQEPCEDAISRQAVLNIFADNADVTRPYSTVWEKVKALPSVNPQQRVGHWIDDGQYADGHSQHAYRCSKCDESYIGYVGEYKYCPNCGCAMKGEFEDNGEK